MLTTSPPHAGLSAVTDLSSLDAWPVSQRLALLEVLTDSLVGVDRDDEAAPVGQELVDASVRTHRVAERLTGARLAWLDRVEAEGLWAADGSFRSFASYVASSHGMPRSEAVAHVRLARTLRAALPVTAAAVVSGSLSLAKARTLAAVAASSDARIAALAEIAETDAASGDDSAGEQDASDEHGATGRGGNVTVEEVLVRCGAAMRPEDFTTVVRRFAALADPEACDRGFREATEREFLSLSRTTDGFHLIGFLTEASGQFLRGRLNAIMGADTAADGRSHQQRMAHALTALARSGVATGDPVRAQIGITMTLADLERLGLPLPDRADQQRHTDQQRPADQHRRADLQRPAADQQRRTDRGPSADWKRQLAEQPARWFDGSGPVPDPVLRDLLDGADIYRVVFGPDSSVLDVGRSNRVFPRRLRNAIISRDGGCVCPDCHLPAPYCEVHHVVAWQHGGRTCVENGALLCGHHNRLVDQKQISMTRNVRSGHAPPGLGHNLWTFWDRNGNQITPLALADTG